MYPSLTVEVKIGGQGVSEGNAEKRNSDGRKPLQNPHISEIPKEPIDGNPEKLLLSEKSTLNTCADDPLKTLAIGRKNLFPKAMNQTLISTAHLANLLPTGTLIAFQILSPIFSNNGQCDSFGRRMTEALVILCGTSCFAVSFTDSFRGGNGKICYGFATPRGLRAFDYAGAEIPDAAKYKLRFVDFVHAFLSVLVFLAIVVYDQNVVNCVYPTPKSVTKKALNVLPVGIGVICSLFFVLFPTTRHGFGYPGSNA